MKLEQRRKRDGSKRPTPSQGLKDPIASENVCHLKEDQLREVTLDELKLGVNEGCILWVKTITSPSFVNSLVLIVEDSKKDSMALGLYNTVEPEDTDY